MNIDPNEWSLFSEFLPESTKEKLFNPAANAIGKGVGGIFDLIFYRLIKYHIYSKIKLKSYAKKVADNLNKIPNDKRSTAKLDTATKIMEASKFCINNDTLQSWFAKLLSSSVDSRKNKLVSNYFPLVLSNMNISDAAFLNKFSGHIDNFPIGNLKYGDETGFHVFERDLVDWGWRDKDVNIAQTQENEINLLQSFNIINVTYEKMLTGEKAKEAYEFLRTFHGPKLKVNNILKNVEIEKGILRLTSIGKRFLMVALPNKTK